MAMSNRGLTKVVEECGELVQICAKKIAYPHTDHHPDCRGSMRARLEDEIADVLAATAFVAEEFELDDTRIAKRMGEKLEKFKLWDLQNG